MYGLKKTLFFLMLELRYKYGQIISKSFSQQGEDLVVDRLLNSKKNGFYVDVGANDPHRFSNTKKFYLKGWRGINIEPNTEKYLKFIKDRPEDINLNFGINSKISKIKFYRFFPDTLSTFSPKQAKQYTREGYKNTGEEIILTLPLSRVLTKYAKNQKIDFMSVDTEGFDEIVLKSNNWKKYSPKIICIESNKSKQSRIRKYLYNLKYGLVYDNGLNSIYRKND